MAHYRKKTEAEIFVCRVQITEGDLQTDYSSRGWFSCRQLFMLKLHARPSFEKALCLRNVILFITVVSTVVGTSKLQDI